MASLNDEIAPTVDWVVKELYDAPSIRAITFAELTKQAISGGHEDTFDWMRQIRTAVCNDLDALLHAPTDNDHRTTYRTKVYDALRQQFATEIGRSPATSKALLAKLVNANTHEQFLTLMTQGITAQTRRSATRQRDLLERDLEKKIAAYKAAHAERRAANAKYWSGKMSYYDHCRLQNKEYDAENVLQSHRNRLRNTKQLLKRSDAYFKSIVTDIAASAARSYVTEHEIAMTAQKVLEKLRPALSKWIRISKDGKIAYRLSPTRYYAPQIAGVGFSQTPPVRYLFGEPTEGEQGTRIDPQRYRQEPLDALLQRYHDMPCNEKATRRLALLADAAGKENFPVPENQWGTFTAKIRDALKANGGLLTWKQQLDELAAFMQNRPEDAEITALLRILKKYALDSCETMLRDVRGRLRIEDAKTPAKLKLSAMATGQSCIRHSSMPEYRGMVNDPGSRFLVGYRDDVVQGYARLFLMEAGAPVLGVDTIEPPHKDFDTHKDLVNAFGLVAIDLGLRMGAKMIVGSDARIKFGLRQMYGNTERRLRNPHKLGFPEPFTRYTMFDNEFLDVHVLMENWAPHVRA